MGQQEKEFDRSVCFSFFEDYCQHVENVEKEFGIETAYKVIMAIVKYGLYEEEPEDSKMKILVNKTILKSIDLSQKRRSRGFSGEDLEKTQKVIDYYRDHPDASQNEIAKATGISKGKVNKVIRKIKEEELNNSNPISSSNSSSSSSSNSSMTVTVTGSTESHTEDASLDADAPKPDTKKKKELEYVITKEIKEQIWQMFKDGYKYIDIESKTGIKRGKIYSIIEDLKKEKEEDEQKEKQKRAEERLNLEANRMIEESKKTKSENLILSKLDDFKRLDFGSSMTNIDILNIIERTYYASKSNGTISDIKQAITDEFQDWPYSCRNIDAIGKCIDYLDNISV